MSQVAFPLSSTSTSPGTSRLDDNALHSHPTGSAQLQGVATISPVPTMQPGRAGQQRPVHLSLQCSPAELADKDAQLQPVASNAAITSLPRTASQVILLASIEFSWLWNTAWYAAR